MDIYFKILEKELENCQKHMQEYKLQGCYDVFNDAVLCTYQYIKNKYPKNKRLLGFAKSCL